MKMIKEGIIAAIGNTALVRLTRVLNCSFRVYAKLEGLNPGGSIKDRPALEIIQRGIMSGRIDPETVVVEASSGNMGVGVAQVCRYFGLRFICVTDSKATAQHLQLLKVYGAEVEVVLQPDPLTGDLLPARINRARQIAEKLKNSFFINQYDNCFAARAHYRTMGEIVATLNGHLDYVFCCASSCGTLRGCAEYVRKHRGGRTKIIAADAAGSVIFGGTPGKRMIAGHGAGMRPGLYQDGLADQIVKVTDLECIAGCRRLLADEALLVGGSSGGVFMALNHVRDQIAPRDNCVMLFPDRGERYLDTIFSDNWVQTNFGTLPRYSERETIAVAG